MDVEQKQYGLKMWSNSAHNVPASDVYEKQGPNGQDWWVHSVGSVSKHGELRQ
jgi:hypothetical protein